MNNFEKYLPVGTVVLLKNGKKRLMITGFAPVSNENKDKIYDYTGCFFPSGVLSTEENFLFDHEQIEKVFSLGYMDEEGKTFIEQLNKVMTEDNKKNMLEAIKNKKGE